MRYVVIGAGWLWGMAALPQVTDAGVGLGFLLLFFGGSLTGLVWVVYSFAAPGVFRAPRVRWLWLSVPVICLASLLLCFTHRDLAIRVWLCDSALRESAEAVRQNPDAGRQSRRVGLFEVNNASADEKQVALETVDGFMTRSGIVYRPDGTRPEYGQRHGSCQYEHLYGPWWRFDEMID